jgi:hypothetical protein
MIFSASYSKKDHMGKTDETLKANKIMIVMRKTVTLMSENEKKHDRPLDFNATTSLPFP